MVIVTERCFVVADKINNISIREERDYDAKVTVNPVSTKHSRKSKILHKDIPIVRYIITIYYEPQGRTDHDSCQIITYDKQTAENIFREAVQQYREQNPDAVYLDKIAERFLSGI